MADPHRATTTKELMCTSYPNQKKRDISVSAPHIMSLVTGFSDEVVEQFMAPLPKRKGGK